MALYPRVYYAFRVDSKVIMNLLRTLASALIICSAVISHAQDVPQVAAASDLKFALDEIVIAYTKETGGSVKVAYGSSGNFRQQISQGAPFQLFLSADESNVSALASEGRTRDSGTPYAIGRIVLFAPYGSSLKPDAAQVDKITPMNQSRRSIRRCRGGASRCRS